MLQFNDYQCVLIENISDFEKAYPFLRSSGTITFNEYYKEYSRLLQFPLYLENAHSAYSGSSIGLRSSPVGTWSKQELEIISLKDILI